LGHSPSWRGAVIRSGYCAISSTALGTFRKCRLQRSTSAFGRKADLVDFRLGEQCALRGAAGGIALISSLGNLGPAVAPSVTGLITASTGSPLYSTYLVAAAYVLSGLLLLILVRPADPSRVADVRRERSFTFLGKPSRNIPVHGPQRPGGHLPADPFSVTEP